MTVKYKLAESVVCISDMVKQNLVQSVRGTSDHLSHAQWVSIRIDLGSSVAPRFGRFLIISAIHSNYDRRIRSRVVPLNSTTALLRNSTPLSDSGSVIGMVVEDMADDGMRMDETLVVGGRR